MKAGVFKGETYLHLFTGVSLRAPWSVGWHSPPSKHPDVAFPLFFAVVSCFIIFIYYSAYKFRFAGRISFVSFTNFFFFFIILLHFLFTGLVCFHFLYFLFFTFSHHSSVIVFARWFRWPRAAPF